VSAAEAAISPGGRSQGFGAAPTVMEAEEGPPPLSHGLAGGAAGSNCLVADTASSHSLFLTCHSAPAERGRYQANDSEQGDSLSLTEGRQSQKGFQGI
jgi:hypothetical protein